MLGERANAEHDSDHSRAIRIEWVKVVRAYSRGNLTRETDKLVALTGLASRIQLYTGWNYIGGLWEQNILSQLFWFHYAGYPRVPGKRSSKYRVPTWSWASIDGEIAWYHPSPEYKWLATIVSTHVELKDTSYPFSEVMGGELRVRGSLQTAYGVKKVQGPRRMPTI